MAYQRAVSCPLKGFPRARATYRTISTATIIHNEAKKPHIDNKASLPRIGIDSNTLDLLDDMNLGLGSGHRSVRRKRPLIYDEPAERDHADIKSKAEAQRSSEVAQEDASYIMTEAEELAALDEIARRAGDEIFSSSVVGEEDLLSSEPREERRSPAAAFGSKRIGSVELPEELVNAIQNQVDTVENPKLLRQAYLSQMSTKPSFRAPASSRASSKRAHLSSSLQEHQASPKSSSSHYDTRRREAVTPLSALLSAIVDLPGEYAAVRNVLRELKGRLGVEGWNGMIAGSSTKKWLVLDGGVGAGLWAIQDIMHLLPSNPREEHVATAGPRLDLVHGSRHILDLAQTIARDADLQGDINFSRIYRLKDKPSTILVPYLLSKLPNQPARRRKLKELWETGAETIIVIDEGTTDGFRIVAGARQYLLDLGRQTPIAAEGMEPEEIDRLILRNKRKAKRNRRKAREGDALEGTVEIVDGKEVLRVGDQIFYAEEDAESASIEENDDIVEPVEDGTQDTYVNGQDASVNDQFVGSHVIAPCPHDGTCPLLATRDNCHSSQRIQTPRFLRKTKHNKDGESDSNYSYVVVRRGHRPVARTTGSGLVGGVGKDERERNALKEESMRQGLIVPIKGARDGSVEVMRYIPPSEKQEVAIEVEEEVDQEDLRKEAYYWPRLVYPPLKRSGHVVMDTCHPSGSIVRLTIPKSQSKQAYYDARKVMWGDLFPHAPKSKEKVRDRGIKRLNKVEPAEEGIEMDEEDDLEDILVEESWPVAKLVEAEEREQAKRGIDTIVKTFNQGS